MGDPVRCKKLHNIWCSDKIYETGENGAKIWSISHSDDQISVGDRMSLMQNELELDILEELGAEFYKRNV